MVCYKKFMQTTTYRTDSIITDLTDDEVELVHMYRRAKKLHHSEITIAVQDGKRIKLWLTEKRR